MKLTKVMKFLENKYMLYLVFAVSIIKLISNMVSGENEKVILFILIGIVSAFFSKNMTIILLIPLVLTSIYGASQFEGLKNKGDKEGEGDKEEDDEEPKKKPDTLPEIITGPDASDLTTTTDSMTLYKKNKRVDYASTLEDAYGDLNNILDSDGIKNLTGDTKKLMEQQKQLAGALKNMTPLISQAQDMLKGFDIKGLTDVAKSFSSPEGALDKGK